MNKKYSYLALALMIFSALIPPINFYVSAPLEQWPMIILLAGFFGTAIIFMNVNVFVKIVSVGSFINCFFSVAPYISFTSYIAVVSCCYFYLVCSLVEDWKIIFKGLQSIVILTLIIIFMQCIGKDSLLNFGREVKCFGTVGNSMQMGSLSVILTAVLISYNPINFIFPLVVSFFCNSLWGVMVFGVGLYVWLVKNNRNFAREILALCIVVFFGFAVCHEKFKDNMIVSGRVPVWKKTIELAIKRPMTGYGIGSYKDIFPALAQFNCTPYKTAHNCWLQLLFEVGFPGLLLAFGLFSWTLYNLFIKNEFLCASGLAMIGTDMLVHFPTREIQCVLIMISFFAYCGQKISFKKVG